MQPGVGNLHVQGRHVFSRLEGEAGVLGIFLAQRVEGEGGIFGRGKVVDVPAGEQGAEHDAHGAEFPGGGSIGKSIADDEARGISVENKGAEQRDFLLSFAGKAEGEGHAVVIADDFLEKTPAFGIDDAGVNAAGKGNDPAVHRNGIFKRGKEHISPRRGLYGQQSVIAAGIASLCGAGGIVPQSVGEEPFPVHVAGGV